MSSTDTPIKSALPGVNILLEGPAGTGKTTALGTLADAGLEVFVLMLESGLESFLGYWTDRGKEIPANVHWHVITPAKAGFDEMLVMADNINKLSFESLTKVSDVNKSKYDTMRKILLALSDFPCDRTGKKFGPVNDWSTGRVLAIDGLTGLNTAAMQNTVGGKPVRGQHEWPIAQIQIEHLLRKLTDDCRCHFVLISHVERETDAVLGGVKITCSTLGKALAPKIPAMFSDVVLAVRQGTKYQWDTANPMADLKTRNLATSATLEPSFVPIVKKWQSRGGVIESA